MDQKAQQEGYADLTSVVSQEKTSSRLREGSAVSSSQDVLVETKGIGRRRSFEAGG